MKKFWMPALFIVVLITSCKNDELAIQKFSLDNFQFSDCKNEKSASSYISGPLEYRFENGNMLYVKHIDVVFNCCQSENNLTIDATLSGDSIFIHEYEKKPGLCKCICPYDMECTVGPLAEKQYWIIVKIGEIESFRFPIYFNKELDSALKVYNETD